MKQIYLLILLWIIPALSVIAQESWQKSIDSYAPFGNNFIEKADSNGWFHIAGTKSFSTGQSRGEIVVSRYDQCGKVRWSYRYGNDTVSLKISDAIKDNAGNLVITGYYLLSPDYYLGHVFVMKISLNGNLLWLKHYDQYGYDYPYSIGQLSDGNYFVFYNHDRISAIVPFNCILKLSPNGNIIWNKSFYVNPIWGSAIATSDGGILVQSGNLIYKLNSAGSVLWANHYSPVHYCTKALEVNNNYVFAQYPSSLSDSVCYLFTLTANGSQGLISQAFHGNSLKDLQRLSNGNFLVYGSVRTNGGINESCITEIDALGTIVSQQIVQTSNILQTQFSGSFCELDNHSLVMSGALQNSVPHPYTNSLILYKSSVLTNFSCTVPFLGSAITAPFLTPTSTGDHITTNSPIPKDIPINRNPLPLNFTFSCFVPDTNKIQLGNDTTLCNNKPLVLNAFIGNMYKYIWSTGAETPSITINQAGTYWVKAYACDTIYDTIRVEYVTPLQLIYTITPLITQPNTPVSFVNYTTPIASILWNTGDSTIYTANTFEHSYTNGGVYFPTLTVTDTNGCKYTAKTKVIVDEFAFYVPNSFTPDGDGINDIFTPTGVGIASWEMVIYNRWGEELFTGKNQGWNGLLKRNLPAPEGVYVYIITLKNELGAESVRKGNLTLVRSGK